MSPRVYVRKFDWDEARRLRAEGLSWNQLAQRFGVSQTAVERACKPDLRERMAATIRAKQRSGTCVDCGTQISFNYSRPVERCLECSAIAKATTVRDGELSCHTCREWKPDESFPSDRRRIARRGRHRQCTSCQTKARNDWRRRNLEKQRASDRERARQRKAA